MAWSRIPNFHMSLLCLHQTVSVGSWFIPLAAKDGHYLSTLLTPEGAAWGAGRRRGEHL